MTAPPGRRGEATRPPTDADRLRELIAETAEYPMARQRVAAVHDFFAGLDPVAASRLTRSEPRLVGNLDGAPFPLRCEANRLRMSWDRDLLSEQIAGGVASRAEYTRHATLERMLQVTTTVSIDPESGLPRADTRERTFAVYGPGSSPGSVRAAEVLEPSEFRAVTDVQRGLGAAVATGEHGRDEPGSPGCERVKG